MISVIVPYRDAEPYLNRCCKSMARQQGDFEFILVNDNSKDNGKEIAEEYANKDDRFKSLDNARSPGVSGARNTGLDNAAGDMITFLDADDELFKEAWQTFNRAMTIDADMIQYNHLRYYKKLNKVALKYTNHEGWFHVSRLPILWCYVWNKTFTRTLVEDIRFKGGMQFGEDELFNLECLSKTKRIYNVNEITTIHHFENGNSLARSKTAERIWQQAHALEDFIKSQEDPDMRVCACKILSEHWQSKTYIKMIGEGANRT